MTQIRDKITIEYIDEDGIYIALTPGPDGIVILSANGNSPNEACWELEKAYELAMPADDKLERCSCDEALLLRSMLEGTKTWLINLRDNEERCMYEKEGDKLLDEIIEVLDK